MEAALAAFVALAETAALAAFVALAETAALAASVVLVVQSSAWIPPVEVDLAGHSHPWA